MLSYELTFRMAPEVAGVDENGGYDFSCDVWSGNSFICKYLNAFNFSRNNCNRVGWIGATALWTQSDESFAFARKVKLQTSEVEG
jgi:hypothetical protein